MPHKLYRVIAFEIADDYTLDITFHDGTQRTINFEPVLRGEVFGPLQDLTLFNQVRLSAEARTLVWPTGADFDPETLRNWDDDQMKKLGQRWARVAVAA